MEGRKELIKESLDLFEKTACKETYEMAKGIEAVVDFLITKLRTN